MAAIKKTGLFQKFAMQYGALTELKSKHFKYNNKIYYHLPKMVSDDAYIKQQQSDGDMYIKQQEQLRNQNPRFDKKKYSVLELMKIELNASRKDYLAYDRKVGNERHLQPRYHAPVFVPHKVLPEIRVLVGL